MRTIACVVLTGLLCTIGCKNAPQNKTSESQPVATKPDPDGWRSLFDGKSLDGWKITRFGGGSNAFVEEGELVIPGGTPISGVTYIQKPDAPLPTTNYELEFEARRREGSDFFATATFPVGKDYASLVLGGWGGGTVGISSLDGMDASENDTGTHKRFQKNKWYKIRVRVLPQQLIAWIDDEKLVDTETTDRQINVRIEVEPSIPLGFATYETEGGIKNIRIRELPESQRKPIPPADPKPRDAEEMPEE